MRLIDSNVDNEGRLEVCVSGVWGGVCGANFGRSDAYVACSHLGYSGASKCLHVLSMCWFDIHLLLFSSMNRTLGEICCLSRRE